MFNIDAIDRYGENGITCMYARELITEDRPLIWRVNLGEVGMFVEIEMEDEYWEWRSYELLKKQMIQERKRKTLRFQQQWAIMTSWWRHFTSQDIFPMSYFRNAEESDEEDSEEYGSDEEETDEESDEESDEASQDSEKEGESSQPVNEKQQLENMYNTEAEPVNQPEKVNNDSEESPPPTYRNWI